jgi:hypothetical protein
VATAQGPEPAARLLHPSRTRLAMNALPFTEDSAMFVGKFFQK